MAKVFINGEIDLTKLTREELIDFIQVLRQIRKNYEDKFGIVMFANGETRPVEK